MCCSGAGVPCASWQAGGVLGAMAVLLALSGSWAAMSLSAF